MSIENLTVLAHSFHCLKKMVIRTHGLRELLHVLANRSDFYWLTLEDSGTAPAVHLLQRTGQHFSMQSV